MKPVKLTIINTGNELVIFNDTTGETITKESYTLMMRDALKDAIKMLRAYEGNEHA